ncbi:MAG: hypothetical protein JW934_14705 [Anaerolineae bacterium]|nr:hypothetical protein [Anaerolineae bacterium]
MRAQKTQYIQFSPIKRLWQTVGLLEDDQQNTFQVYLTATTKEAISDLLQQFEEGQFKIEISVTPVEPSKRTGDVSSMLSDEIAPQVYWDDINIGISRLNIKTPPPYRITYIIDPPLGQGKTTRVDYNDPGSTEVECEADLGQVSVALYEIEPHGQEILHASGLADPYTVATLRSTATHDGHWRVRVTGQQQSNRFSLKYDKWRLV